MLEERQVMLGDSRTGHVRIKTGHVRGQTGYGGGETGNVMIQTDRI